MKTQNHIPPIEKAVAIAGGVSVLAKACGVSLQAVYKWLKKGYPPENRRKSIEAAVNGRVSRFDLLPPDFHLNKENPCDT